MPKVRWISFGGTPGDIFIGNLKTGVLSHPRKEKAIYRPRYRETVVIEGTKDRRSPRSGSWTQYTL